MARDRRGVPTIAVDFVAFALDALLVCSALLTLPSLEVPYFVRERDVPFG